MDLEIREALALSDDRAAALAQLLPGSEDHDYFRALHLQHAGRFDEVDQLLLAWPERHGSTERYHRLRLRQLFYRVATGTERSTTETQRAAADDLRDWLGVAHWHEAEVEELAPSRPSRLADDAFSGEALLRQAVDHDANLSQVTDEGLLELVARPLDLARRRALLARLAHSPQPELVVLVAEELAQRGSSGFGALSVHQFLTIEQLRAVADRVPDRLHSHVGWVSAVMTRMRPHHAIDLDLDLDARAAHLAALWKLVAPLPAAINSIKGHVLWHVLDTQRRRSEPIDLDLVGMYLQLPRTTAYAPRRRHEGVRHDELVQHGADFRNVTGLPPAGSDEELVRDLVQREPEIAERYGRYLDREWLETELAIASLLYGRPDADRATITLGPSRAAALRERVELAWCLDNPTRVAADQPVALAVDVKHVGELLVKVFRVDPIAYFQHHHREVNTDLDLDGLAASHEEVLRSTEPPVRRVRRTIELPACARPGTYVIDLIGNGMSSRAVVHKGRLRHAVRYGAAGHVVTIVDEAGTPLPGARAILGNREYIADERGAILVAFSTAPGRTPVLLAHGEIATVAHLELVRETPQLAMNLVVEREALASGRPVKAIARVDLLIAGYPASLQLLKRAMWDVTITDRHGVASTKSQPLALDDVDSTVLEFPLGDDVAAVDVAIRAAIDIRSEQREHELSDRRTAQVATIHAAAAVEALYLARTVNGWVLSALGKTGEPRAGRPVTVSLVHRWAKTQLNVELATDARGRIELGMLPGCEWVAATLGGLTQRWHVGEAGLGARLHVPHGGDVLVPIPSGRTADEVLRRLSLVELRANVPARHARCELEPLEGGLVIRGLAPGDYDLRAPGLHVAIAVALPGTEVGAGTYVTPGEVIQTPRAVPVVAALATAGDRVRLALRGADPATRVHVVASRFASSLVDPIAQGPARVPGRRVERVRGALYVSGRDIGDEYRYVLERRNQKRYPNLLLDKPSLLLNPWSRRTTTTDVAAAKGGGAFRPAPAPAAQPGFAAQQQAYGAAATDAAFASYDFLPGSVTVIANLVADASGVVEIARGELGTATTVTFVVDDPAGTTVRRAHLPEAPLEPRDLRLVLALDPARHATQQKAIAPLGAGGTLVVEDLATAKVHLLDSVERAHGYLLALRDDATLREFAFVTRWHSLGDAERRELYSKYACHELHLFLYFKDRPFFDAVIRPYLAHKRTKTFVDHYLLGADLVRYLEPAALVRLNAVETALLAQRLAADDTLGRIMGDQVALLPPDPARDARLIDALLGASSLDGDESLASLQSEATTAALEREDRMMAIGMAGAAMPMTAAPMPAAPMARGAAMVGRRDALKKDAAPRKAKKRAMAADEAEESYGADLDDLEMDVALREEATPHYRGADKTQEWAEHNWWHRTPAQSGPDMIAPSRLWRDLARHRPDRADAGPFLSPGLGLAANSFAEMMCALAVTELPFVAQPARLVADGPRLTITAQVNTLAGSSQLVDGELVTGGLPLVVGMSYVRADDRYDWSTGEQVDKYVEGPLSTGVIYTCQVVLANPTSTRQRISALVQIPRGSIAVASSRVTHTVDVLLEPYGTHGHEFSFYFPTPGTWTHFPVHVTRGGAIVAAAPARLLEVSAGRATSDPRSWAHVSQRGTVADVVAYLETANLASIELTKIAWRLRDRAAYDAILRAVEARRGYDETLWGYALLHRDAPRIRTWLRALGERLLQGGPVLDMLDVDAEQLGTYEHLELAPLINARAHRLGGKLRILNDGLAAQYHRFLELVAHRSRPSAEDLLAAAHYLLAQDRVDDATRILARVDAEALADRMQHDYLAAYVACLHADTTTAHALAARWREHPVDRWRHRFGGLAGMLDELTGRAPAVLDPKSREQQHADLAAKQPTFDLAVSRDGVELRSQHVTALELRFFVMDVELLFSRQPFVQSDVSRFSFIEPGHRQPLVDLAPEVRVPWPEALRGKNVVVEAVAAGQRKAKVHYANDLATQLANHVGQVRVQRASDRSGLPATYVKVYAKKRGGAVEFYKDGYTDLRGWFDYATLSTSDLDHVERFAILVCSDAAGAAILETAPPQR